METQDLEIEVTEGERRTAGELLQFWPLAPVIPVAAAVAHLLAKPASWSRTQKRVLAAAGVVVGLNLVRWQLQRFFTPRPRYEVLQHDGPFEVRRYPAMVVAQTRVNLGFDLALTEGFQRLAGFIFGRNTGQEHVSMTTPVVTQHESLHFDSLTSEAQDDGGYTVSFVMPPQRTVQDLPLPEDDRVTLRELQPRTVAALRFSGRYDNERVRRASERLMAEARSHGIEVLGEPAFAGYDSPSTLPLLRRNEVWVQVAD
ncbi:MAG: heme-binding protein [Archangium sp.]|nr:heme-binding protein [Archangium sp.]